MAISRRKDANRKMKKIVYLLSIIGLLSSLAWSACAKPASAPAQRQPVDIKMLTGKLGSGGYSTGAGWADILKKNSPWLRATVLETGGSVDNIKYGFDDPKERALDLRWLTASLITSAWRGETPFDKKYTGQKAIMFGYAGLDTFFTLDPNIRTYQDLIGKKVATGARGSSLAYTGDLILRDICGIVDKVNVVYLSFGEAKDALMDGAIHAMMGTIQLVGPKKWEVQEALIEPWQTKPTPHFLIPPREQAERAINEKGLPYSYLTCPKGALGPKQTEDWSGLSYHLYWGAYPEMSDDIVYEMVRVAYENAHVIGDYTPAGKAFTRETMAWFPIMYKSEEEVHPGALKFYKEHNVKLYMGGKSPPS